MIGSLVVGVAAAKALAFATVLPLYAAERRGDAARADARTLVADPNLSFV